MDVDRMVFLREEIEKLKTKKTLRLKMIKRAKAEQIRVAQQVNEEITKAAKLKEREGAQQNILKKALSERQIAMLHSENTSRTMITDDEFAVAYTLQLYSNQHFYNYFTTHLNYPLPAWRRTLRWANLQMRNANKQNDK